MSDTFWLCIVTAVLGLATVGAVLVFGWRVFLAIFPGRLYEYIDRVINFWQATNLRPNLPKYFADSYGDYLQRRNEFWTAYGQVLVAVLLITLLTILLLTKTITAEAGLPILSAISGFAIAKGVSSGRSSTVGPDRDDQR